MATPTATKQEPCATHERIAIDLRGRVASGVWSPGQMLPGRRALAAQYGVALTTVEHAVATLIAEGWLRVDGRRGTFVVRAEDASAPQRAGDGETRSAGARATVGVVATVSHWDDPDIARNQWPLRVLDACEQQLCGNPGLTLRYVNAAEYGSDRAAEREAIERLLARPVSAVILIAQKSLGPTLACLRRAEVPVVCANYDPLDIGVPQVCIDGAAGGALALDHLVSRGCTRIVFYAPHTGVWVRARLRGARAAAGRAGLRVSDFDTEVQDGVAADELGTTGLATLTSATAERVALRLAPGTGVIAANDWAALAVMRAARTRGLEAGRDYAVVGFDDRARASGLSSLRPPLEDVGKEAARLAERLIHGDVVPARVLLQHRLIVRESTRQLAPSATRNPT